MYTTLFLLCIACMIVYGILFVRYWDAVYYYGEERVGFHVWLKKLIVSFWARNK